MLFLMHKAVKYYSGAMGILPENSPISHLVSEQGMTMWSYCRQRRSLNFWILAFKIPDYYFSCKVATVFIRWVWQVHSPWMMAYGTKWLFPWWTHWPGPPGGKWKWTTKHLLWPVQLPLGASTFWKIIQTFMSVTELLTRRRAWKGV